MTGFGDRLKRSGGSHRAPIGATGTDPEPSALWLSSCGKTLSALDQKKSYANCRTEAQHPINEAFTMAAKLEQVGLNE